MYSSRVTVLVGHFGSGKTEIAINGALDLARQGRRAVLIDLDVVKPYFRSRSARELMAERGVEVIAPQGENVFGDLPIIVPRVRGVLRDGATRLILDAGGDPTGARALGSLVDALPAEETETLAVLNFRRPFTQSAEDAVSMVRAIEAAARTPVTGLVSNTHLMAETTPETVAEGYRLARDTAERLSLPVVAVAAEEAVAARLPAAELECPVVVLHRVVMPPFEVHRERRASGPLFVLN